METSHLTDSLNQIQRKAVTAPVGPYLVLAGAGSGKTRVLVHRIAWLIQVEDASPQGILAVTFTNKAASEMRGRIESLLGIPISSLWVGTFHGIAHRLLRLHWREANLPTHFQIIDSEDQLRLIKRILKQLGLNEARWSARQIQWDINKYKDEGLRAAQLTDENSPSYNCPFARVYRAYQEVCEQGGMVDFADLLLRAHELWRNNPDLLAHYRKRFPHLLIDEFQDTNTIQYRWMRQLAGTDGTPFIVGDDDQSIYGWRGAKVENLNRLKKDFPALTIFRLEQNYRSTGTILAAANAIIANNTERLGKNLWSEGDKGEPIQIYQASDEQDEAAFVVERIQHWMTEEGRARRDIAVLYRSNAQSRLLEEALIMADVPYRIYGGVRFFERAEIKDALAFLRLIVNRNNDAAFERIINRPSRGIGERTLVKLRETAHAQQLSLWGASVRLIEDNVLTARAAKAVRDFLLLIDRLTGNTDDLELCQQVEYVIKASGLLDYYQKEEGEPGKTRLENLEELVNTARHFVLRSALTQSSLTEFLTHAALEAGEGQSNADDDCVQLMTLHSAKGLEFPLIFIVGMEEGIFPSARSLYEPARLEEERRLCYVGITRAQYHLYLIHAEYRRLYGSDRYPEPSRFIDEIPTELIDEPESSIPMAIYTSETGFQLGQPVKHHKFGNGIILNFEGKGEQARVQVNFNRAGTKWLVMAYANLQAL